MPILAVRLTPVGREGASLLTTLDQAYAVLGCETTEHQSIVVGGLCQLIVRMLANIESTGELTYSKPIPGVERPVFAKRFQLFKRVKREAEKSVAYNAIGFAQFIVFFHCSIIV